MNDTTVDLPHEIALFRYGLIADLVHLPPGTKGLYRHLEKKAAREYTIPGTSRTRVAAETLRDWLKRYRKGGFDTLLPKPRADRGTPRALSAAIAEQLLAIKEDNPKLSVRLVIEQARDSGAVPEDKHLPLSSVHRLLSSHGLMQRRPDEPTDQDRRRFAFERAGQLWMSDVMHGPGVPLAGRARRKTYLIGFLDDATRIVPHGVFAHSESTRVFLPVLKQAIFRRGFPQRLYVDNGANYRSHHLALVCAKLGIALIHARPYRPQGKGKIERFFRSVRAQLLTRLTLEAKQRPVLIVDEAHHLRNEVLEDLRLLTNYEMDSQNRLCLLLVGLTELRRRLRMAVHESLAQRIVVRYHMAGLAREELPDYLTHRLRLAGCELPLFEPPAIEALFQATQGMPRKLNRLAHYALTSAAINKARSVSTEHVQGALEEIDP